jgi:hypothetical protein
MNVKRNNIESDHVRINFLLNTISQFRQQTEVEAQNFTHK